MNEFKTSPLQGPNGTNFLHGIIDARNGAVVVVKIVGPPVIVKLIDGTNFPEFCKGGGYRSFGDEEPVLKSHVRVPVTRAGQWHLVVGPVSSDDSRVSYHVE
jgi:hypothetical protein